MIQRAALRRIAAALLTSELRRTRGADGVPVPCGPDAWSDRWPLGETGLGLDSLEAVNAAAALNEMFHLDEVERPATPPGSFGGWLDRIEAAQRGGVARLTVLTSGTTGAPRPCVHAIEDLTTEADYFGQMFAGRRRVLALAPAHHIYGLIWTALLPAALGIPVITVAAGSMPPLQPGDLVVAVPTLWQALARGQRHWPPDVEGISAGSPLDAQLAIDLRAGGLARMTDIYGASETGGVAFRDASSDSYALLPRWRLAPSFDADRPCVIDRLGREVVLPDRIQPGVDGRFTLAGRRDGAIQVGGINVWPQHVAAVLRRCPGVVDIAVRAGAGERFKAYVVPSGFDDLDALRDRVHAYAMRMLSAPERPVSYRFGAALPSTPLGKAMDWA